MMKTYTEYLNEFIRTYLKDTYFDSYREKMIEAFNVGFSSGAAWTLNQTGHVTDNRTD